MSSDSITGKKRTCAGRDVILALAEGVHLHDGVPRPMVLVEVLGNSETAVAVLSELSAVTRGQPEYRGGDEARAPDRSGHVLRG